MTRDNSKYIIYVVVGCLLAILIVQGFLVVDYYKTTRRALQRESNSILQEAFKKDLNIRENEYHEKIIRLEIKDRDEKYDFSKEDPKVFNTMDVLSLVMNISVSTQCPIKLNNFDSITNSVLHSRGISSKFYIELSSTKNNHTSIIRSKNANTLLSFLQIRSQPLTINIHPQQTLTLVLENPLDIILKRMALMLISSMAFSVLCFVAYGRLMKILAQQKQLVRFKNDFLSTIAHELKRPVGSLIFNLDCLHMPAFRTSDDKYFGTLSKSMEATVELNNTIQMIVDLARAEEGILKPETRIIEMASLLEQLAEKFRQQSYKSIQIVIKNETSNSRTKGDEKLLIQCFANLLDNAIKYSYENVSIVITIKRNDKQLEIAVSDNGIGIEADKLEGIFEKYNRLGNAPKVNGFGIGLHYVKTIISLHKGAVRVESDLKHGSTFTIALPF